MTYYVLEAVKEGERVLYPRQNTRSSINDHSSREFSLEEELFHDQYKHIYARYRFHTRDPYRFYDTMDYDIKCPRCGDILRLCGNPIDLHGHGLYRCRRCDEGRR